MDIRYFFIASAVTSGLALAMQESDSIANQEPSPIVAPYTFYEHNSQFIKYISSTSDQLSILQTQGTTEAQTGDKDDLYQKGKKFLTILSEFLYTLFLFCMQTFLAGSGGGASHGA
ncbi:hypothetical protein [Bartonella phoceensis]|uniref:hypothetical protein n=1 Tax=Bartonella phoceensis TaxID=270249 RepID=UPI001ABAC79B|nr:hypothetical protein [Bartonella phoceensis]